MRIKCKIILFLILVSCHFSNAQRKNKNDKWFTYEECTEEIKENILKGDLATANYWAKERITRASDEYGKYTYQKLLAHIDQAWFDYLSGKRTDLEDSFGDIESLFENYNIKNGLTNENYFVEVLRFNNNKILYLLDNKLIDEIRQLLEYNLFVIKEIEKEGGYILDEKLITLANGHYYYNAINDNKTANIYITDLEYLLRLTSGNSINTEALMIANKSVGDYYFNIADFKKASIYYLRFLELSKQCLLFEYDKPGVLLRLSKCEFERENFSNAMLVSGECLELLKHRMGRKHPIYIDALSNHAFILDQNPINNEKTEFLHWEILNLLEKRKGVKSIEYASAFFRWLGNITRQSKLTDVYDLARDEFIKSRMESAIGILENKMGSADLQYIEALTLMGFYRITNNEVDEGAKNLVEANRRLTEKTYNQIGFMTEAEQTELIRYYETKLDLTHNIFLANQDKKPELIGLMYDNYLILKGMLLNSSKILQTVTNGTESSDPVLEASISRFSFLRSELGKAYSLDENGNETKIEAIKNELQQIEKELLINSPSIAKVKEGFSKTWRDVQAGLSEKQAAIEFVRLRDFDLTNLRPEDSLSYIALVVSKSSLYPKAIRVCSEDQLKGFLLSKETEIDLAYVDRLYEIRGTGKKVVAKTSTRPTSKQPKKPAKPTAAPPTIQAPKSVGTLYDLVWKPLETSLVGVEDIFYSPTGLLYKVAFAAISNQQKLLIDQINLVQVSSTKSLLPGNNFTFKFNSDWDIELFGGIDYGQVDGGILWPALSGTEKEVDEITKLFDPQKVITKKGSNASERNFKSRSGKSSSIMHLATHGYFSEGREKQEEKVPFLISSNPLIRSGILLAGANFAWNSKVPDRELEDGILTAYELSNLNLSSTRLAVLSACETGLGDIENNEGVFGLQRALKMAGVEQYIISLWEVPDAETQQLMLLFYKKLVEGNTVQVAFTHAQREMRKKYSPYYWAAFVLVR